MRVEYRGVHNEGVRYFDCCQVSVEGVTYEDGGGLDEGKQPLLDVGESGGYGVKFGRGYARVSRSYVSLRVCK